jgi:GNAT superfamily N-acetyltransferase
MLDYARLSPGEPADRVAVMVTFMQMVEPPPRLAQELPAGAVLARKRLSVPAYRKLYAEVGSRWLWWLRRMMPDEMLARHLADPAVATHVLTLNGEKAGFFELDATYWPDVNLNYFGLVPGVIGQGLGMKLLRAAIDEVFPVNSPSQVRRLTVNTCTADHPRALPNYLAVGFKEVRRVREIWDIPRRLGLQIPDHLRA